MYKYRINILLHKMTKHQFRMAIVDLPFILGVSNTTLHRWRYIKINESFDIPFTKLLQLAGYFEVKPQDMYTDFERTLNDDFKKLKNKTHEELQKD